MGLLLTDEQKGQIRETLEETEAPCRYYLGTVMDAERWTKIFSDCTDHDDIFMVTVIEDIKLWMSLFPRGNNIPNPSAYAARLYEFMCENNGLTHLGVKMILDEILKARKQVPSIYEIAADFEPIKERYLEFRKSRRQFMRLYYNAEQNFIRQLDDANISSSLSDIFDIQQLIKAWHILFPYDPLPGCDIGGHPFKPDKTADLVINALSKPRHENPLLMVFLIIIEVAQKDKTTQYSMIDIYEEMAKLYPDVPSMRGSPNSFYLPNQWKCLDLSNLKPDHEADYGLFDAEELIPGLIDPDRSQTEIIDYVRKITHDYFTAEAMFQ